LTHLELPAGSRAQRLFDRLEEAFRGFLAGLPPGLEELARQRGTYHGDLVPWPFEGLGGLNPVLVGTPWLFWEAFQALDDETFVQLAEAGATFVLASVVLDHLVDGQTAAPGALCLYHQALYSRGVTLYRQALPPASDFWGHFDRLAAEHLAGLAAESAAQARPADYTRETLTTTAHGKVAPIVATLAGFCAAAGQMASFPAMEASLKHISVASQLLDDIGDWQADVREHHLTYFLALLGPAETWSGTDWPEVDTLQGALDAEWADVAQLKRVRQGLEQAIGAAQGLDCPAWVRYVDGYRAITDGHLDSCIRRHLVRVLSLTRQE
jgi:hypothetical protein